MNLRQVKFRRCPDIHYKYNGLFHQWVTLNEEEQDFVYGLIELRDGTMEYVKLENIMFVFKRSFLYKLLSFFKNDN